MDIPGSATPICSRTADQVCAQQTRCAIVELAAAPGGGELAAGEPLCPQRARTDCHFYQARAGKGVNPTPWGGGCKRFITIKGPVPLVLCLVKRVPSHVNDAPVRLQLWGLKARWKPRTGAKGLMRGNGEGAGGRGAPHTLALLQGDLAGLPPLAAKAKDTPWRRPQRPGIQN